MSHLITVAIVCGQRQLHEWAQAIAVIRSKMSARLLDLQRQFNDGINRLIQEDVSGLAASLSANFAQNRVSQTPSCSRRSYKRKRPEFLYLRLTCLGGPHVETVSTKMICALNKIGLGHATPDNKCLKVTLSLSAEEFTNFLEERFPNLKGTNFQLMKMDASRKLVALPEQINCPKDIQIWNQLKRSSLYIRPCTIIEVENVEEIPVEQQLENYNESVISDGHLQSICPVCSRTFENGECIYCAQMMDYNQSLSTDNAKLDDAPSSEITNNEAMKTVRQQRSMLVGEEPVEGFPIRIRLPNNEIVTRRFTTSQHLEDLINFVGSLTDSTYHFTLSVPGFSPFKSTTILHDLTLEDLDITQPTVLNVAWGSDLDINTGVPHNQSSANSTAGNEIHYATPASDPGSAVSPVQDPYSENLREDQHRVVVIRKGHTVSDFLSEFKEHSNFCLPRVFQMEGEEAQDGGGVAREAFTRFWSELQVRFGIGIKTTVLKVSDIMSETDWVSVGRILAKGYTDLGLLPHGFNRAFLISCLCGYGSVGDGMLLSAMLEDFSQYEQDLYRKACEGALAPDEEDEFSDILNIYCCSRVPKAKDVNATLIALAQTLFVQAPKCVIDNVNKGISSCLKPAPSIGRVVKDLEAQLPCARLVLKLFENGLTKNDIEDRTFRYFKQFIRACSCADLQCLMRLMTGSPTIVVPSIGVTFVAITGDLFFRTCGPVLELPLYNTPEMLSNAFRTVLDCKMWDFNRL